MILLLLTALPLFVSFYLSRLILCIVTVDGNSMEPNLKSGDSVLVIQHIPSIFLRKNQIIVLDLLKVDSIPYPKPSNVIKRVVGLQNDIVEIPVSKVDAHTWLGKTALKKNSGYYELYVPKHHCFVKADSTGSDSCHWGTIPYNAILGIVIRKMSI